MDTVEILRTLVAFDTTSHRSNLDFIRWTATYLGRGARACLQSEQPPAIVLHRQRRAANGVELRFDECLVVRFNAKCGHRGYHHRNASQRKFSQPRFGGVCFLAIPSLSRKHAKTTTTPWTRMPMCGPGRSSWTA